MTASSRRLDQWLWFARFFKSRSLATRICADGRVRVNSAPVAKAHHAIKVGDVLTFAQGARVRVVRVLGLGTRRGPASEAQALYRDEAAPSASAPDRARAPGKRDKGAGRPTKADRRAIDKLQEVD